VEAEGGGRVGEKRDGEGPKNAGNRATTEDVAGVGNGDEKGKRGKADRKTGREKERKKKKN
jgi:hypothetical protein